MIQSILYGNGINRVTGGIPSWNELLKEISDVDLDNSIPNTLKYEVILMEKPFLEVKCAYKSNLDDSSEELTEKILKGKIADRLSHFTSNRLYDDIRKLPVSHFITTNYDNSLFQSSGKGILNTRFPIEKIYSIRRNYLMENTSSEKQQYWPIHGNIDSPVSIMLGFDHYCGSLAKIDNYVKGGYDLHGMKVESMSNRLRKGLTDVISWVDLFFVSDIHIIGLNLGYEETDIWWLLNRRKRLKLANPNMIQNRIYYYPVEEMTNDLQQVLLGFDVRIISLSLSELSGNQYLERYQSQLEQMKREFR